MPANPFNGYTDYGIGIGLRVPHYRHILEKKPVVDWFEIISENFMVDGGRPLEVLDLILEQYRVVQHGVAIYFGSADKLSREHLKKLKRLVKRTNTPWLSDHLCWGSVDGGYTRVYRSPKSFFSDGRGLASQGKGKSMEPASRPVHAEMPTAKIDPRSWVDEHGDCLYRYALVRVRTPEVAEDLVQETLLVAVRSQDKFAGRSSERSWLVGILKNKVVDYYRKLGRETSFTDLEFLKDECSHKFVEQGFWNHDLGPHEWRPEADEVMHKGEFWQTMRNCLSTLPQRVADVFMMREMDDLPSKEICHTLSISESNLWVMLHRARMALRECLEINWFDKVSSPERH
jgi:RNA polymerase sigma-70 factor (TIGR02943 family)